jgi:ribosome biogenesis SPOUT family RNA methylase Rps3
MTDCALAPLKEIPYLDHPELNFNEHESTQMPFRYVKGEDGKPIMPEVRVWLGLLSFLFRPS